MALPNTGLSGQFDLVANKSGITLRVSWTETYDEVSNKSVITITDIQGKSSLWYGQSYFFDGSIDVEGAPIVQFSRASRGHYVYWGVLNRFESIRTASGYPAPPWESAEIFHNADGSKTAAITVNISGYTASGQYGSGWTVSETAEILLTEITVSNPDTGPVNADPAIAFFFNGLRICPLYERKYLGTFFIPPAIGVKKTVAGQFIRVDDVAKTGQPLKIQSMPGESVKVYGKNMVDYTQATGRNASQKVEIVDNGVVWKSGGNYFFQIPLSLPAGVTVRGSFTGGTNLAGESIQYFRLNYDDGTMAVLWFQGTSYTITTTKPVNTLTFYKSTPGTALTQDLLVSNIQIEIGTAITAYEAYKGMQTATADENNNVAGLTSVAPTMTVISDEVAVECTYMAISD